MKNPGIKLNTTGLTSSLKVHTTQQIGQSIRPLINRFVRVNKILLLGLILIPLTSLQAQQEVYRLPVFSVSGVNPCASGFDLDGACFYYYSALEKDSSNQLKAALADLDKAVAIRPDFAEAIDLRGMVFLKVGKFSRAIHDFNTAIKLMPGNAEFYNHRGVANYCINQFALALRDYTLAIEMDTTLARAYYNRGLLKLEIGDDEGAQADFVLANAKGHEISGKLISTIE